MRGPDRWSVPARAVAALALVVAASVLAGTPGGARATSRLVDKPDLVPILPTTPSATQKTPFYVDAKTYPGALLYHFDAVLFNQGGTLDIYRDPATAHVIQAIWRGGIPSVLPDPNRIPPANAPGLSTIDLTARGAIVTYVAGGSHNHFHFRAAAKYSLHVPGTGTLPSAKVGFCFGDDWGTPPVQYFPYPYIGPGLPWCALGHPEATFFREGISPQSGDIYNSQIQYQWIDVTGLQPGTYALEAVVNPQHLLEEADYSNNAVTQQRTIPGLITPPLTSAGSGRRTLRLHATVVAPAIPARVSENCFPVSSSTNCLVSDLGAPNVTFRVASKPCFGSASLRPGGATDATVTYVPRTGAPVDGFAYSATDKRGLTSTGGAVFVGRPSAAGKPVACLIEGHVGPDRRAHLSFITSGKLPAGAHWALFVDARPTSARLGARTVTSRVLPSGRTGFWLEPVKNGRPLAHRIQSREFVLDVPALVRPAD
jgi:hypothetical protein